ncbi:MAG: dapE 1 [Gammaproteobacteria bacterium]|jgi:succinyl-diaminopimelate desuccinylase|nr:dapE 1 [Gammaproteobacteria bacterium]
MSSILSLLKDLIYCPSVTPQDAGCQEIISQRLKLLNFHIESMRFNDVDNLWARYGTQAPLIVFAGHTDVVPPGPLDAWVTPPFEPHIREEYLYGRGAADMKSGLATMIIAVENFLKKNPQCAGSIAFLITSDEEGVSIDGTKRVVETLLQRNEKMDYCVIGEATSNNFIGDQIRVGRRGSLSGNLKLFGKQGHVAFPHLAENVIHLIAPALQELTTFTWDQGNQYFPPTTFQISNLHAGTGANNVIPGDLNMHFNFRFSTAVTAEELQHRVTQILEKHHLKFDLQWNYSGQPFLTHQGQLIRAVKQAIQEITALDTILSTGGGTSDGRFIAPTGTEVIELGPCNASVHQANEHVRIPDLNVLSEIYERILELLLN